MFQNIQPSIVFEHSILSRRAAIETDAYWNACDDDVICFANHKQDLDQVLVMPSTSEMLVENGS